MWYEIEKALFPQSKFDHHVFSADLHIVPFGVMDTYDNVHDKLFVSETLFTKMLNEHWHSLSPLHKSSTSPLHDKGWGKAICYRNRLWKNIHKGQDNNYEEEICRRNGPVHLLVALHYIAHNKIMRTEKTTPICIVFNSSASFHGHQLNDYWIKGPDLLKNLFAVTFQFRENDEDVTEVLKNIWEGSYPRARSGCSLIPVEKHGNQSRAWCLCKDSVDLSIQLSQDIHPPYFQTINNTLIRLEKLE